jgi:hypothetical protein
VNIPVPLPSTVLVDKSIVGLLFYSKQFPLAVTVAPPSLEIEPPLEAVVIVTDAAVVVKVGVVKVDR